MATQENLTVFNLVDGVVDEFHDESGTDEAEGSNDTYCATSDLYSNGVPGTISAGFAVASITEPDTSETGDHPAIGSGEMGTYTVPFGMTTADIKVWGAGGTDYGGAGGGGSAEGTLAVTSAMSDKKDKPKAKPKAKAKAKAKPSDQRTNPKDYPVYKKGSKSAKAFQEAYGKAKKNGQKTFTFEGRRYEVK